MKPIKLKVCGLKYPKNQELISQLPIDYAGFIFYKNSKRNTISVSEKLPDHIQKVGVFVDEDITVITKKIKQFNLNVIQLHGSENVDYIVQLKAKITHLKLNDIEIWKAIPVKEVSDLEKINYYENDVNVILLDAKGKNPGGNGIKFNWDYLAHIDSNIPIMLSGGIKIDDIEALTKIKTKNMIWGVDINSGFEINPGLKNASRIQHFINRLN